MATTIESMIPRVSKHTLGELICDLISIPSYPGIPNQENAMAVYIRDFFEKAGIEATLEYVVEGRCNVYATLKGTGRGKNLLFNGHMDTVPPYDMTDALLPRREGSRIIGRGASDMKGSLACMMIAMKILKDSGISLAGDMIFSGVIDEELTSQGTRALLRKGIRADGAIVGEPTGLDVCIGHKGLQWFQFDIHGKAVHGGEQETGINAIRNASLLIQKLEERLIPKISERKHPVIGSSSMNYGFIQGGFQPSTVPGECVLQIDRRWIPGEEYDDVVDEFIMIIEELKKEHAGFACDLRVMEKSIMEDGIIHQGFVTEPSHSLVKEAESAVRGCTGTSPVTSRFNAWSDGGLLSTYGRIPTIILGPGSLACAHTNREYIDIDQAAAAVLIYISIILGFCGEEQT